MMDKETYKREVIRMWDSLRSDEYKGERGGSKSKAPACFTWRDAILITYTKFETVKGGKESCREM